MPRPLLAGLVTALAVFGLGLPRVLARHADPLPPAPATDADPDPARGPGPAAPSGEPATREPAVDAVSTVPDPSPESAPQEDLAGAATTADVQALDQVWRRLDAALSGRGEGDGPLEARATADAVEYLELDGDPARAFERATAAALERVRVERARMEGSGAADVGTPEGQAARRAAWTRWQEEQSDAAAAVAATLPATPRGALFEERLLLWLLRLDYGGRRATAE